MISPNADALKKEMKRHGTNPLLLFGAGHELLIAGHFKEARVKFRLALLYDPRLASKVALCFESILDDDPQNVNARLSMADLHLYLGEVEGAISELEEILDIAPERSDVYNILGKLYLKQSDTDSAITVIESAFKSGIKDTGLVEMLGGAYMEKGRIEDAISLYKGLVAQDLANKNYLRVLGELEGRVSRFDEAADSFYSMLSSDTTMAPEVMRKLEDLKMKDPSSLHVKEVLAEVYVRAVKPVLAVAELEDILNIDPSKLDEVITKYKSILDKYPDEPNTLKALAKALAKKEQFSEAVDEYRKLMRYSDEYADDAIEGFRDILVRFPGQLHAHESLGDAYLKVGRLEDALLEYLDVMRLNNGAARSVIEKCRKISKEDPNMLLVHQVLGQAYILAGDGTNAIAEAEFMIYLDKNNSAAHQIMGDAYLKMGNPVKAQGCFISALKLDPYSTAIHGRYAQASIAVLKNDIENLKKRVDEDPWRLGTHLDIAKLYLMIQDFDKGIKELQTAVKDAGRAPFAYNLLGLTFVELGRFDLAATQFERALDVMPKELNDVSKTVRFNLGAAHEAMGNIPAAVAEYETVLAEDVDFPGLQSRTRNIAGINPELQRNKLIAAVIEKFSERGLMGMWGPDLRHTQESGDILNMSFGQEHNNGGFEHFIKGRAKGAMEEFSLAVQLDPKFFAALNNLSVILMKEGHIEQAQTRLANALTIDPGNAVMHNNMGICYYLNNDIISAAAEFGKALECDPSLSAAYINLGDMMYLKGSAKEAISSWEKLKVNDTLTPIALRRLAYKTVKI